LPRQQTLAVPKIFCGVRLEYFDRGAKPCSLFRPLGALRKLCSLSKGTKTHHRKNGNFYSEPPSFRPTAVFILPRWLG
ncbi:MAG: hypothetical protein IKL18_08765, partial [Oscillospiraceae bacterium]|nr:hypothetical protein [Oscillospiraceae bacterium]